MAETLTKTVVKGTFWSALNRFGVLGLQFITYVILAHILSPSDFGAIGMLSIFIVLSQTFVDGGFNSALIQKKDPTEVDFSTIVFWSMGLGAFLCGLLYLTAPLVAEFYDMPILCSVLRVMGISIIFQGAACIQNAKLQKAMKFKSLSIIDLSSNLLASIVAVVSAYRGAGVWALVLLMMTQSISKFFLLLIVTRWLPKLCFSFSSFKQLFSFGVFIFMGNIMETISNNIQGLVIGKKFSAAQTGYYTQANKMENIVGQSIPQIISTVMYPLFSKLQNERDKLRNLIVTDIRIISFAVYPLLSILIIFAPDIIMLLFGSKWLQSAPYYRILCVGAFFFSINNINFYAVASKGKSRILFYGSIYRFAMMCILIAIGVNFGMIGLMWSLAINMANIFFTNAVLCQHYVGTRMIDELKAIAPAVLLSAAASAITLIAYNSLSLIWGFGVLIFIITYISFAAIFKVRVLKEIKIILMKLTNK